MKSFGNAPGKHTYGAKIRVQEQCSDSKCQIFFFFFFLLKPDSDFLKYSGKKI